MVSKCLIGGWRGYVVVLFYFLVGSAIACGWAWEQKSQRESLRNVLERRAQKMSWGSALTAAAVMLGILVLPAFGQNWINYYLLLVGCSWFAANSDTCW